MNTEYPCLPLIQERFWNAIKDDAPTREKIGDRQPSFDVTVFSEWWGSTALGFPGMGGDAMTKAYTTVIEEENSGWYGVFFGDRLAYLVPRANERFLDDLNRHQMLSVREAKKYYK
jgi:hypothetical protein